MPLLGGEAKILTQLVLAEAERLDKVLPDVVVGLAAPETAHATPHTRASNGEQDNRQQQRNGGMSYLDTRIADEKPCGAWMCARACIFCGARQANLIGVWADGSARSVMLRVGSNEGL